MFEFGVQNIRRLESTESFKILPLNILVGRNSSGKSTYLRCLPLLKQSVVTRTSSPILWYGDSVDFGSFEQSIHDNDSSGTIRFSFGIDKIAGARRLNIDQEDYFFRHIPFEFGEIHLEVGICKFETGTRISSLILTEASNDVRYKMSVDKRGVVTSLQVDDVEMIGIFKKEELVINSGAVFPQLTVGPKEKSDPVSQPGLTRPDFSISVRDAFAEAFQSRLDARTTKNTLQKLILSLLRLNIVSNESVKSTLKDIPNRSWGKFISDIISPGNISDYQKVRRLLLTSLLPTIMNRTSQFLRDTIASSLYIGPARARSERYYRYQDLAVSEIDPDGKNFPMFLSSLREPQLRSFSNWVQSIFSYGVMLSRESGHISIKLTSDQGDVNVVDTGYGVSQILPVLGQIWWSVNRPTRGSVRQLEAPILCIEQPELHLHPAHQSLLADTFAKVVTGDTATRKLNPRASLIIETHSESLINRLGQLIAEKVINAEDVQILVFEPDEESLTSTSVRVSRFNDKGSLTNWPFGFFLPEA